MNRSLKIALSSIAWAAIAAYLVWAGGLGERKRAAVSVHEMRISVRDSAEIGIIRPADVRRWINAAGLDPVGKHIDSIDLMASRRRSAHTISSAPPKPPSVWMAS